LGDRRRRPASAPRVRHRTAAGCPPAGLDLARRLVGRALRPRWHRVRRSARGCRWSMRERPLVGSKTLCPARDLGDVTPVEPVIGIGLEEPRKSARRASGGAAVRSGVKRYRVAHDAVPPGCLVVGRVDPQPPGRGLAPAGSSTGTGVSSAWILSALRTASRMRVTMGGAERRGLSGPASVGRSISMPRAVIISV